MVIFFLFRYHRKCYSNFANASKIERAEKRYIKAMNEEEASVNIMARRPILSFSHQTSEDLQRNLSPNHI